MTTIHLVPQWFFGFDIAIESLFVIVSAVVALVSFYIHRLARHRESLLFGIGFLLISLSYFIKILLNIFVLTEVQSGLLGISLVGLSTLGLIGAYANILLFSMGLLTLTYMTFRAKSKRVYALLTVLLVTLLLIARDTAHAYLLASSIFFAFLTIHYGLEYERTRNTKTFLVLNAFALLLLSNLWFLFVADVFYLSFVISLAMELASYLLIATSLFLTFRKKSYG